MQDLLTLHLWLITASLGIMIPIIAIVVGGITTYLHRSRQAELDASLKQEMIQRGMSAEEIVRVINARSKTSKHDPQC